MHWFHLCKQNKTITLIAVKCYVKANFFIVSVTGYLNVKKNVDDKTVIGQGNIGYRDKLLSNSV